METSNNQSTQQLIAGNRNLTPVYGLSLLLALLFTLASILGLLDPDRIYPTEDLRQSFLANDVVNLVIGLPTLFGALWLAWRGKLVGLLFWPGALMYVLYTYLAYIFSVPMGWYYVLLLAIVALSGYTLIGLVASIDIAKIGRHLSGCVPVKLPAGILIFFGAFMFLRVFGVIASMMADPSSVPASELAILPADFLISPCWIIGGVLLWQRKPLGYAAGLGLLFQASMLFIGLIAVLLLQPIYTQAPFDLVATLTVFSMGLVCSVPFALFLRGVAHVRQTDSG